MGGRNAPKWVAGIERNSRPDATEMTGRIGAKYAHSAGTFSDWNNLGEFFSGIGERQTTDLIMLCLHQKGVRGLAGIDSKTTGDP